MYTEAKCWSGMLLPLSPLKYNNKTRTHSVMRGWSSGSPGRSPCEWEKLAIYFVMKKVLSWVSAKEATCVNFKAGFRHDPNTSECVCACERERRRWEKGRCALPPTPRPGERKVAAMSLSLSLSVEGDATVSGLSTSVASFAMWNQRQAYKNVCSVAAQYGARSLWTPDPGLLPLCCAAAPWELPADQTGWHPGDVIWPILPRRYLTSQTPDRSLTGPHLTLTLRSLSLDRLSDRYSRC